MARPTCHLPRPTLALLAACFLAIPAAAAPAPPCDELLRYVPEDVGFCVVLRDMRGQAAALLTAERTALNFLQRLSGIATLARQFADAAGGRITVLDTRKTTPLLRALEKYAVRAGGASNHRTGLDDGILIKDNHIRLAGGVGCYFAVTKLKAAFGYDDSLDVFGVHGVGSTVGMLMLGVLASAEVNPAIAGTFKRGDEVVTLAGGGSQLVNQLLGIGITALLSAVVSFVLLKLIEATVGLRVDEQEELEGLDVHEHGVPGYVNDDMLVH